MFCPKCGKINPDTEELCSGCGAVLHEEQTAPLPKKGRGLKIAIALIAVVAVVVITVLVLSGCNPGNIVKDNISF